MQSVFRRKIHFLCLPAKKQRIWRKIRAPQEKKSAATAKKP